MRHQDYDQLHILVNGIEITFFQYPYKIIPLKEFNGIIKVPGLLELDAMKAIALGGRNKWKDYVDLYFLLKDHFTIKQIAERANELFGVRVFNSKLFRQELYYFTDINYSEEVNYLPGFSKTNKEIQTFLEEIALEKL